MPYPNEHSARLQDPKRFDPDAYRRTKGGTIYGRKKIPSNISIIWGKFTGKAAPADPPIPQSLRFPILDWGEEPTKAKKWLEDNEIKTILFEPAGVSMVEKEESSFITFQVPNANEEEIEDLRLYQEWEASLVEIEIVYGTQKY